MMFNNFEPFKRKTPNVGKPSGPDPLTVALAENQELKNKIAELETLISSMAPDAEEVEVVLEKPAKKAEKKKAAE